MEAFFTKMGTSFFFKKKWEFVFRKWKCFSKVGGFCENGSLFDEKGSFFPENGSLLFEKIVIVDQNGGR